jgi:cell division septal protein FtsQ
MARRKITDTGTEARDWRSIEQKAPSRAPSAHAAERSSRSAWHGFLLLLGVVVVFVGGAYGVYLLSQHREPVLATNAEPVREIHFETDGVLTLPQVNRLVGLPVEALLLETDIHELKDQLESIGQIRRAEVQRSFPDALRITVSENFPLMRMRVQTPDGRQRLLVSRQGSVYLGFGYDPAFIESLPELAGARLRYRAGTGYAPIDGIEPIAALLDAVAEQAPGLARSLQVIDCTEYLPETPRRPGSVLRLRSRVVPHLVFQPGDFEAQLSRLRSVLFAIDREEGSLAGVYQVDLSYSDRAVVTPRPAARAARSS